MDPQKPTIKGIFVNSHIKAVLKQKGAQGVSELERRYGAPLRFRNAQSIPVSEEVKIIEYALDILADQPVPEPDRAFEAGKLHFRNFSTTPLARIIFSMFRKDFKLMMLQSYSIAGHVFRGVRFSTEELGPKSIRVVMRNNDYPLDHFRGLFYEWLHFSGNTGTVTAMGSAERYQYDISWQ